MVKFEFRILCADRHESSDYVKGLMEGFEIREASTREVYDHVGTKDFENADAALEQFRELQKKAGSKIKNAILASAT